MRPYLEKLDQSAIDARNIAALYLIKPVTSATVRKGEGIDRQTWRELLSRKPSLALKQFATGGTILRAHTVIAIVGFALLVPGI